MDWSLFDVTCVEKMKKKCAELPNLDMAIYREHTTLTNIRARSLLVNYCEIRVGWCMEKYIA